jgi:hypothetical protein
VSWFFMVIRPCSCMMRLSALQFKLNVYKYSATACAVKEKPLCILFSLQNLPSYSLVQDLNTPTRAWSCFQWSGVRHH